MKKRYLVFTIFLMFLLFLSLAFGGPNNVWKECSDANDETTETDHLINILSTPYYCCSGETSYYWQENSQCDVEPTTCSDGTPRNTCSSTKPKYCDSNGNLINDCIDCGCFAGQDCQSDGSCNAQCSLGGECTSYGGTCCQGGNLYRCQ